MKKLLALLLTAALALSLTACGGSNDDSKAGGGTTPPVDAEQQTVQTPPEETDPVTDNEDSEKFEPTSISIGDTISLDFLEMTFEEAGMADDIQQSITTEIVTRITGPQPEEGKQFLYIRGTIKNLATDALPVYDFFAGNFQVDGYNFNVSANDSNIITAEGEHLSTIDPLTTGIFTIYASIPDELADAYTSADFTFGFYDLFDNSELAMNRSFSDDPIAECPYQYTISLK